MLGAEQIEAVGAASAGTARRAYDIADPDPMDVLARRSGAHYSPRAAAAFIADQRSLSARVLAPFIRPLCAVLLTVARLARFIVPVGNLNGPLHGLIVWGVRHFCSPSAAYLILRHVHLGTQIIAFLSTNLRIQPEGVEELYPRNVGELRDDAFLKHDLNVFNFLHAAPAVAAPRDDLDYSMLTDDLPLDPPERRWSQVFDLETAVTFYTLMYAVMLPKAAFERASHSLQFDADFAQLAGQLLGQPALALAVSNRHPILRLPTLSTARRVMIHGLETEALHHHLLQSAARSKRRAPKSST